MSRKRGDKQEERKVFTEAEVTKLRKHWYARLADDGFVDIERVTENGFSFLRDNVDRLHIGNRHTGNTQGDLVPIGDDNGFRDPDMHSASYEIAFDLFEANRCYFTRCRQYLHARPFMKQRSRVVWALHCDGLTVREIGRRIGLWPNAVQTIIMACREDMSAWWANSSAQREEERDLRAIDIPEDENEDR